MTGARLVDPTHSTDTGRASERSGPGVSLFWIPLGAGNRTVQFSGRRFESVAARLDHRPPCDLYHSALVAALGSDHYFIEMTPVPGRSQAVTDRGVVGGGPVGTRWAGRLRIFRYEVRCWRNGTIPDLGHAVGGPVVLTDDETLVRSVVDAVRSVPTPTWGRDELHAGEMWNSNSVVSWVLTVTGLQAIAGRPPANGRAPGWDAGITIADRRTDAR